ncbi:MULTISPECIES: FixH family protein [Flavobacteriaceae]|uniref:FixH family protein n=1 Tax=Flavobacteriaceae TaxID=49546 RepID=UPI000C31AD42|nr:MULTISPECIES: FixH family protein [Flavobacteriaceae]AUC76927.1 cytochrome C oxidase Cbb3 [Olleya sp. Bg11-27]QCE42480.1 cytochrome C oxidase Cbb3 [Psychroserpens sp. NJDZ02]QXP59281.1 FixH family protein [Olleya sp. HaHaR_3_96]
MKFNWGTGVVIAFIFFISFILYFVIAMNTDKNLDHDLVNENYYKQELEFQNDINKEKNAKTLDSKILWKKTSEGLVLTFPAELDDQVIKGKVFLYRPSNKQLDFETTILLSNHNLLIPDKRLLDGRWNIKIDWSYKDSKYMFKEEIQY